MEQKKRGRPKLHAEITEAYAPSRRQALNAMYMYEAVCKLSVAATEIPNHEILWYSDPQAKTAGGKDKRAKEKNNGRKENVKRQGTRKGRWRIP